MYVFIVIFLFFTARITLAGVQYTLFLESKPHHLLRSLCLCKLNSLLHLNAMQFLRSK